MGLFFEGWRGMVCGEGGGVEKGVPVPLQCFTLSLKSKHVRLDVLLSPPPVGQP